MTYDPEPEHAVLRGAMADAVLAFDRWKHTGMDTHRRAWLLSVEEVAELCATVDTSEVSDDS
jgi:hypothetical protein